MPMPPIPEMNGNASHQLLAQIVANTGAIANNIAILARQSADTESHVPVVGPPDETGHFRVLCHGCSMKAQAFIYPCQFDPALGAQFPPAHVMVATDPGIPDEAAQGRSEALRLARAGVMDTPDGSIESERLKLIIKVLSI